MSPEKAALQKLDDAQRMECEELLRHWKQRTWLAAAILLSLVTLGVLVTGTQEQWGYGLFSIIAMFMLPASLIFVIVLSVQQKQFVKQVSAIPELQYALPADAPGSVPVKPFDAGQMIMMVLLCLICFPVGILVILIYDRRRRENAVQILTAGEALSRASDSHARSLGCGGFLLLCLAGACMLFEAMNQFVANGKVSAINSEAHSVLNAANSAVAELDEKSLSLPPAGYYIAHASDTFEADSLEAYIEQYFPDLRRTGDWYALEIDGNCNVTAAWVSKQTLTESELQPIDVQEQRRLMESFTHKDEVIGYYRAE